MRVVVVDMQPITPAVGGGRLRLLGLYHALGEGIEVVYVGSYDWPGETLRDQQTTPGLREICVPLSAAHHAAAAELSGKVGGKTVIDAAFSWQARLSPAWVTRARAEIRFADIVVFSHPWAYEPLKDALLPGQTVVYDSQNVESLLKADLLGRAGEAGNVIRKLVENEYALCRRADLVLCCSHSDMASFASLFDLPWRKLRLVPNGAFTDGVPLDRNAARAEARRALDLPDSGKIAVFVGSDYGPNAEAAGFIAHTLAPRLPDVTFLIVGGAGSVVDPALAASNVVCTGVVDADKRDLFLRGADLAVNPMSAGSGTNVKMFDFLAAGLPVVSTETGARGICDAASAPPFIKVRPLDGFQDSIREVLSGHVDFDAGEQPRKYVSRLFSWERISSELGRMLSRAHAGRTRASSRALLFTTWNVACGIAEHAAYLVEALDAEGIDTVVLGNDLAGHEAKGFARDLHHAVARSWKWDTLTWRESGIDIGAVAALLRDDRPDFAIIQHHTAFMPMAGFEALLDLLAQHGVPALVEFHDARHLSPEALASFSRRAGVLLCHDREEAMAFPAEASASVQVLPLPVRMHAGGGETMVEAGSPPVVGGFGFLRPYKGVLDAIRTIALLSDDFPGIRYRGWHALYDAQSADYLAECMDEARLLGIEERIEINTDFLPIDEAIAALARCDLVLLPYAPANEGASAVVNAALASGQALVVSPSRIFNPVADVVHVVAEGDPPHYARAIAMLLGDRARLGELRERGRRWAEAHSYGTAARRIVELVQADVRVASRSASIQRVRGVASDGC